MKHNWEYKLLGEVCILKVGGDKPSEISVTKAVGKSIPIYSNGIDDEGLCGYCCRPTVLESAVTISGRGTLGVPFIRREPFVPIVRLIVAIPREMVRLEYLYYWILNRKFSGNGVAIPQLTVPMIKNEAIPVPPMEEQEKIVAELDQINDLIEKNRELLRNLDALAQSLFYDTFGDPITNTKGWEVKVLKEVSQLINGRAYKQDELLDKGKYKVIRVGNFFTNTDYYYSDLELESDKYIDNGDLIFAWSASFGAFIWQGEKVIYHYHIWKVLYDTNVLNKVFYKYLLNEMTSSFMKDLHGIGMMHLTKSGMEQYMLPVPPLTLQEEFAKRIEAIEAIKATTQQQLAELQTLLDSRIDYWFN